MHKKQTLLILLVIASLTLIAVGAYQVLQGSNGQDQTATPGPTPSMAEVRRISVQDLHAKLQKSNPAPSVGCAQRRGFCWGTHRKFTSCRIQRHSRAGEGA